MCTYTNNRSIVVSSHGQRETETTPERMRCFHVYRENLKSLRIRSDADARNFNRERSGKFVIPIYFT